MHAHRKSKVWGELFWEEVVGSNQMDWRVWKTSNYHSAGVYPMAPSAAKVVSRDFTECFFQ